MALKALLMYMNRHAAEPGKLSPVVELARRHGAHLTGLFVMPPRAIPSYVATSIPAEVFENQERELKTQAEALQTAFEAELEAAGVTGEWRQVRGYTDQQINRQARFADLVVMPQATDSGLLSAGESVEHRVVLGAGRPVLLIPRGGVSGEPATRAVIAWNGRREAARAAADALPLLTAAERVEVVTVGKTEAEHDRFGADELCRYLGRHGVTARPTRLDPGNGSVGERLAAAAQEFDANLMVMGAYGHGRLFEAVLGGATQHLVEQMPVPLLMAH